ncbi:CapA family protein [Bacteroides sp. 214]|uniref:CapA family protein n=1 Tax=Bacteroides sp. 214 TaxID=2302935 RepID=UPI0013D2196E|nr:CapA family protein [Bacteroides sp. 214]NDW11420.1 CapA family protein [Bacteroides sp. 214]
MKQLFLLLLLLLSCSCITREKQVEKHREGDINTDSISSTDSISLLFVGDIMQHQAQIDAARVGQSYNYLECFRYVKEEISEADIAIGNLEVTLGGKPYRGYPSFSSPDELVFAIQDAGFDVLLTANNHSLDRATKGINRTISILDSLNIPHAGTYTDSIARKKQYPLLLEKNNFRISLLAYTYGTNGLVPKQPCIVNYIDKKVILQDLEIARTQNPDVIIACMHWGDEYNSQPNKTQKELAKWLIEQGVNHVIGAHPHVIQPYELRTDTLSGEQNMVVYSLGNFISNMSLLGRDGGMMFRLDLVKDNTVRIANYAHTLVWTARPNQQNRKIHTLIPEYHPQDSLSTNEQEKMKIFIENSRKIVVK